MSDAFGADAVKPLILKKKIKGAAAGHGGAWKIAYADFVTAMMAFFLLLWLLNATTEDSIHGISQYFAPPNASDSDDGVGEALGGLVVAVEGAMRSANSRPSVAIALPTYGAESSGNESGEKRESTELIDQAVAQASPTPQELDLLDEATAQLRQSIQQIPELQQSQDSLIIEEIADGLRIQLLDQETKPMFEENADQLTRHAQRLLALMGSIIVRLPHDIAIIGHSNNQPPRHESPTYSRWELSSDRALNAQRWLLEAGLPQDRIITVSGKSDTELLDYHHPESTRNNRISIILLRPNGPAKPKKLLPPAGATAAEGRAPPAASEGSSDTTTNNSGIPSLPPPPSLPKP